LAIVNTGLAMSCYSHSQKEIKLKLKTHSNTFKNIAKHGVIFPNFLFSPSLQKRSVTIAITAHAFAP